MGLTLRRRKGSKNWQLRGTVDGVYVEESTGTSERRAAEIIKSKREVEIVKGGVSGHGQSVTFLEGAVSYLESLPERGKDRKNSEQKRCIVRLLTYFPVTTVAMDIGQIQAEECALALYPGAAPDTIRRSCIGPLQAVLNHIERMPNADGFRAPNFEKSKWPAGKGRTRWVTPAEAAAFLKHADADLAAFFTFLLYTGCRMSDVMPLEWPQVNLTNRLARFLDDKNGDNRLCHLPEQAVVALANLRSADGSSARHGRVFFMYATKKDVYKAWHPAAKAAELKGVTPHILCHTYATWLVEYAGAGAKDLLETKRWKSLTSVMRYLHAPEQRVRDKIDAMPSASAQKSGQYPGRRKKKAARSNG